MPNNYAQKTFIPSPKEDGSKDYSINARPMANCVSLVQAINKLRLTHDGDYGADEFAIDVINQMHKHAFAGAPERKQKLNQFCSSAFLYFMTNGQHGFSPIHLQKEDSDVRDFLKDASSELGDWVIAHMSNHPDSARAKHWANAKESLALAKQAIADKAKLADADKNRKNALAKQNKKHRAELSDMAKQIAKLTELVESTQTQTAMQVAIGNRDSGK